jgi:CO/xanthine dehydrogenase FAD-binding subunit
VKPAPFHYAAPDTEEQALALLHAHGGEAKLLAGGQSLVPLLNMRLARPSVIIDLNRLKTLDYIREDDGEIRIGAMTRQRTAERSAVVGRRLPLLAAALPFVVHLQIRSRGTMGGSIAHADPSGELPAVLVALNGSVVVRDRGRTRVIRGEDFFVSYLTTAMRPDELLTEVRVPVHDGKGTAFLEIARRHGDYALVGVAAVVTMDGNRCAQARLAFTGVGPTPVRIPEAEAAVAETVLTDAVLADVRALVSDRIDPEDDVHASVQYRKDVAGVLAERALRVAAARAMQPADDLADHGHHGGEI